MMKITQFLLISVLFNPVFYSIAQVNPDTVQFSPAIEAPQALLIPPQNNVFRKNIIKVNLSSFALYNNSLSYERTLSRKISLVAGYRYMPEIKATTPYLAEKVIERYGKENSNLEKGLNSIVVGNNTFTSEVRFYGGKKPGSRGFYLSLYGRYMHLTANVLHEYNTNKGTYTIPLIGTIKGLAGGLMFGAQWLIAKRVAFDWYIIGGHYGKLKVDMLGISNLSTMTSDEIRGLKDDIESINENLIGNADVKATVTDQGVNLKGSVPYAGIRGLGFSFGFAF